MCRYFQSTQQAVYENMRLLLEKFMTIYMMYDGYMCVGSEYAAIFKVHNKLFFLNIYLLQIGELMTI